MKKFRAAVNFVPATGNNVLCRIKELGNSSPSIRMNKALFGDIAPSQHESFIFEVEGLAQSGAYLIPTGACKIVTREAADATPFDVDAYLANLANDDLPF